MNISQENNGDTLFPHNFIQILDHIRHIASSESYQNNHKSFLLPNSIIEDNPTLKMCMLVELILNQSVTPTSSLILQRRDQSSSYPPPVALSFHPRHARLIMH